MTHQIIISDFQIDLFIKLIQNAKTTKYNTTEKEELEILSDCLQSIKADQNPNNLNDLTDY